MKLYARIEQDGQNIYRQLTGAKDEPIKVTLDLNNNSKATVTYTPGATADSKLTVYLDEGTYTVEETGKPDNTEKVTTGDKNANLKTLTIAQGEEETAIFYNKELLGKITIHKVGVKPGQPEQALPGAVFGLFDDKEKANDGSNPIKQVTSDDTGNAVFDNLAYDTYYIKEIGAPEGYRADTTVYEFTIPSNENETSLAKTITNTANLAQVILQKKIRDTESENYKDVDSNTRNIFNENGGSFTIQKKKSDGSWQDLAGTGYTNISLNTNGKIIKNLPVYDDNGQVITYRFKEILPQGWHAEGESEETINEKKVRVAYSKEFNLKDHLGKTCNIVMYNDRNGSITLTKEFYEATANAMQPSDDPSLIATFALYYSDNNTGTGLQPYTVNGNTVTQTVQAGQEITFADLPRTIDDKNVYYYLVETNSPDGYASSQKDKVELDGINAASLLNGTQKVDGKDCPVYGPFNFTDKISTGSSGGTKNMEVILDQTAIINNVEQKVPVLIKKIDSYTEKFVSGAEYSVYEYVDEETDYSEGTPIIEKVSIENENGSFQKLDFGKKYIVIETKVPQGYTDVTAERIIDLTDVVNIDVDTEKRTVTLENRPDPWIKVNKTLVNADGKTTSLNGVSFGVYKKTGEKSFEEVKVYGQSKILTVTSGAQTGTQLPAGEYYLKEIIPEVNPNAILDPSNEKYSEFYPYDGDNKVGIRTEEGFFFGPYNVVDQEDTQELGPIQNYSNKGAVTVTKKGAVVGGQATPLSGAEISIYKKGDLEHAIATVTSNSNGKATFNNLDIYDNDGDKITYIIKETSAPSGYTISETALEVQLHPGETVTKDINNNDLELINQPVTTFTVNKVYYNMWEHEFTQKEYRLPGTVIALYEKEGDTYKFKEVGTTNDNGSVEFNNLAQEKEYVAIEVCVPAEKEYQYLEPRDYQPSSTKKKIYLDADYDGNPASLQSTISGEDIDKYSYVRKEANISGQPVNPEPETLVNVENWAQLQIEKYKKKNSDEGEEDDNRIQINNAQFDLYMQVVDNGAITPDQNGNLPLAYTENPENYTYIGSYSSGTLYDEDGKRMDGWFATDILKAADNVVYWLVERNAGIGGKIRKENVVTLIKRQGTDYVNTTTYSLDGEEVYPTAVMEYVDNTVTKTRFENDPTDGGGGAMFSTVRIAKWAGSYDNEGNKKEEYIPLGNAIFELHLVDSTGHPYKKLDTLTTGLDNDKIGTSEDHTLTSWASSKAFSWEQMVAIKAALKEEGISDDTLNDIFLSDEDGNQYVRVMIQEIGAPSGYWAEKNTFYMYMFFANEGNKTTEIFNDAYYVKGDHTTDDEDVELAENQDGITWAIYPTIEDQSTKEYTPYKNYSNPGNDNSEQQYRLVNWPIDRQAVTVQKYGYEVKEGDGGNLGMSSEELNAYYADIYTDRVPLAGVSMRLERYMNNQWSAYDYTDTATENKGEFTTNDTGYFVFPNGLPKGTYRIIELDPPQEESSDYENIYDGTSIAGGDTEQNAAAYYFTVSGKNVHITMYNPKKQSLSIQKKDMSEASVDGVQFKLSKVKNADGTAATQSDTKATAADGTAEFTQIVTGTYKLSETASSTGYSSQYFQKYFEKTYDGAEYNRQDVDPPNNENLNDMVNGNGIFLGFTKSLKQGTNGTSVQITKKTDISDYSINGTLSVLTVKNPKTDNFQIKKVDQDDPTTVLSGAKFSVKYLSFNDVVENEQNIFGISPVDITVNSGEEIWKFIKKDTTNTGGIIQISNANPGIYQIIEEEAPSGYNKSDASQYIVLTGGLQIGTVTVDGKSIQKVTPDPQDNKVVTFTNEQQVTLHVSKTITDSVDVPVDTAKESTFTFTLYGSSTNNGNTTVNTADVKDTKTISATGKDVGDAIDFTGLTRGETYYLKETSATDFAFTDLRPDEGQTGGQIEKEGEYYKIILPDSSSGLSVTAENTYLYGKVSIKKVDGTNGNALSDAKFTVYRKGTDGEKELLSNVTFTEIKDGAGQGTGIYSAELPLTSTSGDTFYICEKKAPEGYLLSSGCIEVLNLQPGQYRQVQDGSYTTDEDKLAHSIFPNYKGATIKLVKYDNVREAKNGTEENKPQEMSGVEFNLYERNKDGSGSWQSLDTKITDLQGEISFLVDTTKQYALEEVNTTATGKYQGLEGIYQFGENGESDTPVQTESVEVDDQQTTLYVLDSSIEMGKTYTYNAYNIPYVNLEIRKFNALNPSDASARMTATAQLYDVTDITQLNEGDITDDEVNAFLLSQDAADALIQDNIQVNQNGQVAGTSGETNYYNFAQIENKIVAGRTYLVVEKQANDQAGNEVSQIRDNNMVQWYERVVVPEGHKTSVQATLKNVQGSASLELKKEVKDQQESYTSLFTNGTTVQYSIQPTVNNKYPLSNFVVTDEGLKAFDASNQELSGYMTGNYSLTEVTVGKASHTTSNYDPGEHIIKATVTFINSAGKTVYTQSVDVSAGAQTVCLPETSEKAEKIEISYVSETFKNATTFALPDNQQDGYYVLGTDFNPGEITVTAVLDKQNGGKEADGNNLKKAIAKVQNKATSTLEYYSWTSDGTRQKAEPIQREATADIAFKAQKIAKVSVSKTANKETVSLGENVTYDITLKNTEDATAALENPYIIDILPQGTSFVKYGNEDQNNDGKEDEIYLVAGDTGITLQNVTTMSKDDEKAVRIDLNGQLEPGKSIIVKLVVKAENAIASYGASMQNYVLAGSNVPGVVSEENPNGASFKNENDAWPNIMSNLLSNFGVSENRINTVENMLQEQKTEGFVAAQKKIDWTAGSDTVLVKSAKGNADINSGYSTDILSTVTNKNGEMNYRLSVSNTSNLFGKTGVSVVDILPQIGDYTYAQADRGSKWRLTFGNIDRVSIAGTNLNEGSDYKIYYYTGDLSVDPDGEVSSMKQKYKEVYEQVKVIDFNSTPDNLPQNWTSSKPDDNKEISAFIIATRPGIPLNSGYTMVVDYTATVNDREGWDADKLNEYSWQNMVNNFSCTYSQYRLQESIDSAEKTNQIISSNSVSGTIIPGQVKVGGHIWIDKDADGVWEEGESIEDFVGTSVEEENVLIKEMLENTQVHLYSYAGRSSSSNLVETYQKDSDWLTKAYFEFDELIPSMLSNSATEESAYITDTSANAFPGGLLDVTQLKGTAPTTYRIGIEIPTDAGDYRVTSLGKTTGKSRDPQLLQNPADGTEYAKEKKDNNYRVSGKNTVESEQFYLWSRETSIFDNTKDLGIVPERDLKIVKTAEGDSSTKLEGVSFTVYGPFDDEKIKTISQADLTNGTTILTDENGEALFENLLRFQNYVIVENSTVAGYKLDDATGSGGSGTNIEKREISFTNEGKTEKKTIWILKSPSPSIKTSTETVGIENSKVPAKVTLEASKTLTGKGLTANAYTFNLWDENGVNTGNPIQTKQNDVDGKITFDEISFTKAGTYTYYITEQLPEGATQDNNYTVNGITYDTTVYKATVKVDWVEGTGLVINKDTGVTYEKVGGTGTINESTFTNTYSASGSWMPKGTKTLTGRDMKSGETFTFLVKDEKEKIVSTGTATGVAGQQLVNINFEPIDYTLADAGNTYTYTIVEEKAGQKLNGVTYDSRTYTVEVTVSDNGDGTLEVTSTYKNDNATVSSADFTNSYVPTKTEYKPTVEKTLTGQSIPDGTTKEFTFVLEADENNPTGATLPTNNELTIPFNSDGIVKTGKFDAITFTQGGTYTFKITEKSGGQNDGYTYDDAEWTLTVEVTDNQVGALSIDNKPTYKCNNSEVSENNSGAEFTNNYTPAPVDGQLAVSKVVEGAPMAKKETFTFTQAFVSGDEAGVTMPEGDANKVQITVKPDDAADAETNTAQFAAITFTKAGTYYFHITEDTDSLSEGYEKNIVAAKLVEVVVKDENGVLKVDSTKYYPTTDSTKPAENGATAAAFTNEYDTENTVFAPKVTKVFTGDAPTGEKTFTFLLTRGDNQDGVTMPSQNTTSVTYNGNTGTIKDISFDEITFTKAGTYTFKITEQQGGQKDGYTYDASEWTLTVKVEDKNSKLKVTESKYRRKDGTESTDCAEFTNTYDLTPVNYAPQVQKTIEGAAVPENSTASFAFTLTNIGRTDGVNLAEGVTKDVTISAADIKANQGTKQFGTLTFTKAGTYEFQIAETTGTEKGYTYDQKNWKLTITVEDEGGYLEVTKKQYTIMYTAGGEDDGANADKASFTNTYAVTPATYTPQVEKTFSADSVARPTAKDFEFVLTADAKNPENGAFTGGAAGTALAGEHNTLKTTVSGTGTAFFDEITFTKAGTYHFTIKETAGADLGYTYDDAMWTLTVTVTDVGGELTATQTYKSSDDAVQEKDDKAVFENTYSYVASILLNKEVLRGDAAYETNDVFYAGIFTKTTSADGGETTYDRIGDVVTLNNNDSVEVPVPLGGADQTEAITYYVFETDQEGHPLISFGENGEVIYNQPSVYEISVSSKDKDGNDSHIGEVYVTPDGATMHPEVTITNSVSNVSIEKTDMDGAPLSGATLELWKTADSVDADETADAERTKDDEGNVLLETWVSDGTPHELIAELAIGGTYYLHEKEAPEGYVMAADIPFTVENGEPITLVMEDMAQTQAMGQIAVTKRLSTIDESTFDFVALVAADETFYVGLFTDPEGKHPYGEDYVKPIRIQGASSNTATFDNLPSGTYYVFETLQDGTIIPYGEVQDDNGNGVGSFACISDASSGTAKEITLDFAVENIEGTTELNNVYYGDLPDGFSYQGEISITKSIIKNGAPADSSDTFYAGIFTSETENTPYKIVTLENNGTVTVEVPLGGETGMDPITYYIYETDANGNKIDKNSFAYSVGGEGTVALDLNNTTGSRTIINTMASSSENTTTISPTDETKTKKTSDKTGKDKNSSTGTSRRTTSSRTGDDNRVALYVLFFGAAVVGIVISLWKRKKYTE